MFAFLRGTVAHKAADHIALDVGGVGFAVFTPESVYRKLALHQEITLLTYCHIREEAFQIYGFLREEERALFMLLLSISGVGPKVALAVLSALSVPEFGRAVMENDVTALTRAPGVGKKLAQRIILETRGKMGQDTELGVLLGETKAEEETMEGDDAYEALISLGCTPLEAKKAASAARKAMEPGAKDEDVVRTALRAMAKVK